MAKMFYTLEETAQKLGKSEQEVKDMAAAGDLQQFRDRDKLMFKVDQVDAMADVGGATDAGASGTSIPLADSSEGGGFALKEDTAAGADPNEETGMTVFSSDEVEPADPMAQTQVTSEGEDEELQLESVGSGSGLLDLTRESDDTSLGAELLDEIYPGGGESATDANVESGVGSSGVFEGSLSETGHSGPSGLENLQGAGATTSTSVHQPTGVMPVAYDDDEVDPTWSGISAGLMLCVMAALVIVLIAVSAAIVGSTSTLAGAIGGNATYYYATVGGLVVLGVIFAVIGAVVGRSSS